MIDYHDGPAHDCVECRRARIRRGKSHVESCRCHDCNQAQRGDCGWCLGPCLGDCWKARRRSGDDVAHTEWPPEVVRAFNTIALRLNSPNTCELADALVDEQAAVARVRALADRYENEHDWPGIANDIRRALDGDA